jgi:hypothetical protein
MSKKDCKRIVLLAKIILETYHPGWRSSTALEYFGNQISSVSSLGQAQHKRITFMLARKERREFFDSYLKLLQ